MGAAISINGSTVGPGERRTINLPVAKLYTHTNLAMPVHVINGRREGPTLFVCAAIHGDELNGVEIIRRLLKHPAVKRLRGALIAIPIVNVHGFLDRSRYLPDRRDLNRSFPGMERGSLAARIANLFMAEIVAQSQYGIDLHTGGVHRTNLPHIRAYLDDQETARIAKAFGTPVMINADLRDGSLRQAAVEKGVPMLLYEAGEALRFDEVSIRAGVRGIVNVLRELKMLPPTGHPRKSEPRPVVARASNWVRAPESGIFRASVPIGAKVKKGTLLGMVSDSFGESELEVRAPSDGIVIGRSNLPLVHEGEALFHLARFQKVDAVSARVDAFHEDLLPEELPDDGTEGPIV
ncbi:succinylglutamate desuccinylase/aspartoacylase family protein [Thiohalomonas denitrificans]|uniref:Succinylglutamate desuccinylase/Aspartoacylase catalytic domain-containing protein n=1 Tax=Thiohalomonas denitrificans TaxID=415747 RepID=A0A1G5QCR2_9GAMM|nr:succinylglutamate desuccinylase/aspartoacylase family protein [Thiohalomonas denitrificans]SCZ59442.1 hypothetical protein SAMN03097708_01861 [Thiohalomonas denitrificans]